MIHNHRPRDLFIKPISRWHENDCPRLKESFTVQLTTREPIGIILTQRLPRISTSANGRLVQLIKIKINLGITFAESHVKSRCNSLQGCGQQKLCSITRYIIGRSEEQTSELQSLMRHSYAYFCFYKKINIISIPASISK